MGEWRAVCCRVRLGSVALGSFGPHLLNVDLSIGPRLDERVNAGALVKDEEAGARLVARLGAKDDGEGGGVHGQLVIGAVALDLRR